MIRAALACAVLLELAGCAEMPAIDAAAIETQTERIEARIGRACVASGLFDLVGGVVSIALPVAALPIGVLEAGVDQVCADPARFAHDVSTVEWVARNLRDQR